VLPSVVTLECGYQHRWAAAAPGSAPAVPFALLKTKSQAG